MVMDTVRILKCTHPTISALQPFFFFSCDFFDSITSNDRMSTCLFRYITSHFNIDVLFSASMGAGDSPRIYAVLVQPLGQTLGQPSPVWHGIKRGLPGHAGEPGCSCSARRNVSVILASPSLLIIQNDNIMKVVR